MLALIFCFAGVFVFKSSALSINWGDSLKTYDKGNNEGLQLAMSSDGSKVVEFHQSNGLFYHEYYYQVGTVDCNKKTISWGSSHDANDCGMRMEYSL